MKSIGVLGKCGRDFGDGVLKKKGIVKQLTWSRAFFCSFFTISKKEEKGEG